MKRLCMAMVILMGLHSNPVFAAASGFFDNDLCNNAFKFVSCVSNYIMSEYEKGIFNDCTLSEGEYSVRVQNTVHAGAVSACGSVGAGMHSFLLDRLADFTEPYVAAILYDKCTGNNEQVEYDNQSAVVALVQTLVGEGFCVCKQGYYVQPRGLQFGGWGINTECKSCPDGGTTDSEYSIFVDNCYLPAGNFSDTVGSGVYSAACYVTTTWEEKLTSMQ